VRPHNPPPESGLAWLRPILLPALVALSVLVAGGVLIDRQAAVINAERLRADVLAEVSVVRAKLEGNINGNIQLVRGLVATIATEPDMNQARFSVLAAKVFEEQSQLRSIAVAPDLVVEMTYPLEGNAAAIGLDYRTNALQRPAVMRARDTGRLVLAGPVDLVQGGRGFVGRFPVFVQENAGDRFWGVVSAVIDVDRLYADSGLNDAQQGLELSIYGQDALGDNGTRFFGRDLRADSPVTAEVLLPTGSWQIAAVPRGGWETAQADAWILRLGMIGAGLLILTPIIITGRLLGERQANYRGTRARERDLQRLSRRLELALETSQVAVWEMDIATRALVWDERMNPLYGLPSNLIEPTYADWRDAIHPDDRARAETEYADGIRTGRYASDFRVLHQDGTVRYIRSIGAVFADPEDDSKILGVNWDVTSDVTLNEELKRATALTEARNRELEAARVRIEHNALHDSLTGLPNRRFLDEMLKRQAERGFAETGSMALLHIDLDRFKQINDTLGHAAGDAMLVHASGVLRENCRPDDFVARIGGDEFVVLTSATEGDLYLGSLAGRIVEAMRVPVGYEMQQCRIGVSIGIAAERGFAIDVQRLMINADIALYRAKDRGRNRFEFFSDALQAEVVETKRTADEILCGIERNEFIAYYQPQFDAKTRDLVGVEALARWNHPRDGIKTPDSFLPIAEDLNVMATLDRIILEQALADLDRWEKLGLDVPRASVNVSLKRLHDDDLIPGLRQLDIAPGRIAFELVESIYLDESDGIVAWNIDQLKELGIDIEIDDFGTGYASIVSLQKLRPARLKIDRQLVHPILDDPAQRQLLDSIVDIGQAMGIEVVAEGVETMQHAAMLRDMGVDILQGYAFARPLSASQLEEFLRAQAWRRAG
jgi:diguanylate cyclase (GGDEF)-like protein